MLSAAPSVVSDLPAPSASRGQTYSSSVVWNETAPADASDAGSTCTPAGSAVTADSSTSAGWAGRGWTPSRRRNSIRVVSGIWLKR